MKGFSRLLVVLIFAISSVHCTQAPLDPEDDFGMTEESAPEETVGFEDSGFDDLDSEGSQETKTESPPAEEQAEASLDEEFKEAEGAEPTLEPQVAENEAAEGDEFKDFDESGAPDASVAEKAQTEGQEADEFSEFGDEGTETAQNPEAVPEPEVIPEPEIAQGVETPMVDEGPEVPPPVVSEVTPPAEDVPQASQAQVEIKNIRYKANDGGGTVVVEATGPVQYTTRVNPETNQFVIEIPNSKLPNKLKRPFNTKDMQGTIGSIDAYQNNNSTTSRIVVQLREGAAEPVVQSEGNSLLIVSQTAAANVAQNGEADQAPTAPSPELQDAGGESTAGESALLSSQSLEEFLAGNNEFRGKKISIEVTEMDVKDVFKLVSEEVGINLIISDEVKGNVSLKLRQVPWDQALVVIMKTKKLGYTRSGNVIRVAPMADIRGEESDAIKIAADRKSQAPMKVRIIPISYAKPEDLKTQVEQFLTPGKGKVVADPRTSSIMVQDTDEALDKILKLVKSIDIAPPQVLIEGKVVEATDSFNRRVGINWSASGRPGRIDASSSAGSIKTRGDFEVRPGDLGARTFGLNFGIGTLDVLGDLTASLALFEKEDLVKVISSPRIVTLHNEPAKISQVTQIPLLNTSTAGTGPVQTSVTFKDVKLELNVTPQITNDGGVIMKVTVTREFLGAIADEKTEQRPINTRSADTRVLVKNGQTAVIGGIYQSDATQQETKVPWLGDIPLFVWLFKSTSVDRNKNELLIFLTPRILGELDSQGYNPNKGTEL